MSQGKVSPEQMKEFKMTFLRFLFFDASQGGDPGRADSSPEQRPDGRLDIQDLRRIHYDAKPLVQTLKTPLLVLCGRQDPVGIFQTMKVRELNPSAKIVWIERSGHFPWVEAPTPFYGETLSFLK